MSAVIYFKYGSMNSGKSLDLIRMNYNYNENNLKTLVIKPKLDSKKPDKISSRVGIAIDAIEIESTKEIIDVLENNVYDAILVDEVQFFSKEIIDKIVEKCYELQVAAIFYGLKVDFRGEMFEGTKRVFEVADKLEELTSLCWCGEKARNNARIVDGKVTKDGPLIIIEKNNEVEYMPLCNKHFFYNKIK